MKGKKTRKQVFGSLMSFEIEFKNEEFGPDLSGILRVYDRRHLVTEEKFESAQEFATVLKESWKKYTRGAAVAFAVEQRITRWLEEYFREIGHPVSYDELLDFIREGEILSGEKLEEIATVTNLEEELTGKVQKSEQVVVTGKKIAFDEIDTNRLKNVFQAFKREFAPSVVESVTSSVKAKTASGKEIDFDVASPVNESVDSVGGTIRTAVKNTFNEDLLDIQIESIIPFQLAIKNVQSNKAVKQEFETTEEGLKTLITLDVLHNGETLEVAYNFAPRITRVVLLHHESEAITIRTYLDIEIAGDRYIAQTVFVNPFEEIIPTIEIIDYVPRALRVVDANPDIQPPIASMAERAHFHEVHWHHTEIPPSAVLQKDYELVKSPTIHRQFIEIPFDDGVFLIVRAIIAQSAGNLYSLYMLNSQVGKDVEVIMKDHLRGASQVTLMSQSEEVELVDEEDGTSIIWGPSVARRGEIATFGIKFAPSEGFTPGKMEVQINSKSVEIRSRGILRSKEEQLTSVSEEELLMMLNF